jgi:hypothetical protein
MDMNLHNVKIRSVKTSLDSRRPRDLIQRTGNPKKDAIMETRFTEIERANRILLEKMTSIMNTTGPNSAFKP